MSDSYDVIIIGSGAGGGTLARHLAPSGKRILLLERGDWLPREPQNWSAGDVFVDNRYVSPDTWYDADGKAFQPQVHYCVGGATKLYGAALYRLRAEDFGELRHHGGISPAWPISYEEMEPYYTKAEQLYEVHGARGEDPTEPPASAPYPHPAVSHEPRIQQLSDDLRGDGLHPFHAPCGVMLDEGNMPYSACVRCSTCDGFPCLVHAKSDAEVLGVRPALEHANVTLLTNATAVALSTDSGRHVGHRGRRRARRRARDLRRRHRRRLVRRRQHGQAAARARPTSKHPNGLANGSDQVGRNYMFHNSQAVLAISKEPNPTVFQKTLGRQRLLLRERRVGVPDGQHPDGRQVGRPTMYRGEKPLMTKLAPVRTLAEGGRRARGRLLALDRGSAAAREPRDASTARASVTLSYKPTNDAARDRLLEQLRSLLGHLGMHEHHLIPPLGLPGEQDPGRRRRPPGGHVPLRLRPRLLGARTPTAGRTSSTTSTWSTRASSRASGAVNPALTAMANALRVGDHLLERLGA